MVRKFLFGEFHFSEEQREPHDQFLRSLISWEELVIVVCLFFFIFVVGFWISYSRVKNITR